MIGDVQPLLSILIGPKAHISDKEKVLNDLISFVNDPVHSRIYNTSRLIDESHYEKQSYWDFANRLASEHVFSKYGRWCKVYDRYTDSYTDPGNEVKLLRAYLKKNNIQIEKSLSLIEQSWSLEKNARLNENINNNAVLMGL